MKDIHSFMNTRPIVTGRKRFIRNNTENYGIQKMSSMINRDGVEKPNYSTNELTDSLTHSLTHSLIPWNKVLLEKPIS
jgi:hypothetical protein